MALISGSSLMPAPLTPARLLASKHRLAHGFVNNMVAQCAQSSETAQGTIQAPVGTIPFLTTLRARAKKVRSDPAIGCGAQDAAGKEEAKRREPGVGDARKGRNKQVVVPVPVPAPARDACTCDEWPFRAELTGVLPPHYRANARARARRSVASLTSPTFLTGPFNSTTQLPRP